MPKLRIGLIVLTVLLLSGCAGASGTTPSAVTPGAAPTVPGVRSVSVATRRSARPARLGRPRRSQTSSHRPGSLAYSTSSNDRVQPQPAPGSCHAIGFGLDSRPDPRCTPGALNLAVTQATIDRTICVRGWTATVRPAASVTEPEKAASMAAYGDTGSMGEYEYDHFVPLELGGATNDPRNLWPEPGASPNSKDVVEDQLRQAVCGGRLSLARAQHEIVTNWVSLAQGSSPSSPTPSPSSGGSLQGHGDQCTLTASYSSRHDDYDVYVHSNQPRQMVTVTDAYGHSDAWHTDASGYADVYFKSGGYAPGRRVTARVGPATCSTNL